MYAFHNSKKYIKGGIRKAKVKKFKVVPVLN